MSIFSASVPAHFSFDHNFGAIENEQNEFAESYQSLIIKTSSRPNKGWLIYYHMSRFVPYNVLVFLYNRIPGLDFLRNNRTIAHKFARQLLADKVIASSTKGTNRRELMSILVRSNTTADVSSRMSEYELLSQMRIILLAGHEISSTTLSWCFLELAQHPEIQTRLRKEIHDMEPSVKGRGFTAADMDSMPYTQACIKEALRLNPVAYHMHRYATQDIALPLARPIVTKSGKVVCEVPVPKGTRIILSVVGYNRDKSVWGEDADKFIPDRWLKPSEKPEFQVGVYANIATFGGGVRSCIGWRLALLEIQAFLIELVSKFEFAPTDASKNVRAEACSIMAPIVEGELEKGAQAPLKVHEIKHEFHERVLLLHQ